MSSKISVLCWDHRPFAQPHCLAPGTPTNSTMVTRGWHRLLLWSHIFQTLGGFTDMHSLEGLGCFMAVLKGNTKIWTSLLFMILWDFFGQVNNEPFSGVTSGRLQEENWSSYWKFVSYQPLPFSHNPQPLAITILLCSYELTFFNSAYK